MYVGPFYFITCQAYRFHVVSSCCMPCRVCYSLWIVIETDCTADTRAHTSPVLMQVAQFKLIS